MKRAHFVGASGQGKTTLVVEVIEELIRRGYTVGALKHSGHRHELDVQGKDSHRLRTAGASPSAVVAGNLAAVFIESPPSEELQQRLWALFAECDVVLVEGKAQSETPAASVGAPWIEVWRGDVGKAPLAAEVDGISAIVSDDDPGLGTVPVWPRSDVARVTSELIALLDLPDRH